MSLLQSIFRRKSKDPPAKDPPPPTKFKDLKRRTRWLPIWTRGDYMLRNSELIFSAVSRRANALSAMPLQLYQGRKEVRNELNDLMANAPNSNLTSCNFFKTMEACCCTYGNCYALRMVNGLWETERLDIIDPSRVMPLLDEKTNEVWYKIQPDAGEAYYIHSYYIVHIPFLSSNGLVGINPVSVLFDTLIYSDNIKKFSVEQLEKGINAAVVLEAPANLGKDQKEGMIADFQDTYEKTGGNILLLESGVQAKALNLSPVDSKLFEVEKITRSKVATVYNIPPHLMGDYSDISFKSQEQQMLEFLMLTMVPIVTAYEQELNKKLLTPTQRKKGFRFKFDMDALLRADAATRADVNQKAIRGGWFSPDEVRATYGYGHIRGGEKQLVARDLVPLEFLVNHPELVLGAKGGNDSGSSGNDPQKEGTQQDND